MARVLVLVWGPDSKNYVGKSLTLYRDPDVKWGGMAVGGIRISHMSNMKASTPIMLTVTRGKKAPYTVKPLALETPKPAAEPDPTFDWPNYELQVASLIFDATNAESLSKSWEEMKPVRIQARDSDQKRAGENATKINDKIAELS